MNKEDKKIVKQLKNELDNLIKAKEPTDFYKCLENMKELIDKLDK